MLTVILGVLYPLGGVGRVPHPRPARQRRGSTDTDAGRRSSARRRPVVPRPRPSGRDAAARSGGSNKGELQRGLHLVDRRAQGRIAQREGVPEDQVPQDAVTASASGLDPAHQPGLRRAAGAPGGARVRAVRGEGARAGRGQHRRHLHHHRQRDGAEPCHRQRDHAERSRRGRAADLPRRRSRRRQDLRHARRGPPAPGARHRRGRRPRRDPRPGEDRAACSTAWRSCRARRSEHRGLDVHRDGRRRDAGARARGRGRRRARAHQRAGLAQREALAGHRGTARRRHRRAVHGQRPAPGVAQRRRRADHRRRSSRKPCRTRSSAAPSRSSWSTSRPRRCGAGSRTATSTRRTGSTPRWATTSGPATSPRCASWRCCGSPTRSTSRCSGTAAEQEITDTWETRERVVVAITGGPESETLIRRARPDRRPRGRGAAGAARPARRRAGRRRRRTRVARCRKLAEDVGATFHTVVGDDVPTALLEFARGVNATQLVLGTSRRSRLARAFDEGIGADRRAGVRPDRRAHGHARRVPARGRGWKIGRNALTPVAAGSSAGRLALVLPGAGDRARPAVARRAWTTRPTWSATSSPPCVVALVGGLGPALFAAVLGAGLLNFFFTEPLLQPGRARPGERDHAGGDGDRRA